MGFYGFLEVPMNEKDKTMRHRDTEKSEESEESGKHPRFSRF
jgi:hypothetical protein